MNSIDNNKSIWTRKEVYDHAAKHGFYSVSAEACMLLNKRLRTPLKTALYVGLYDADNQTNTAHITVHAMPSIYKQVPAYVQKK